MILKCDCAHKYQDEKHGPSKRVMNKTEKPDTYRCTVCGRLKVKG